MRLSGIEREQRSDAVLARLQAVRTHGPLGRAPGAGGGRRGRRLATNRVQVAFAGVIASRAATRGAWRAVHFDPEGCGLDLELEL